MKNYSNKILLIAIVVFSALLITSCTENISIPDEYNYDDLSKYIKLGEYKNIEYQKETATVSQKEIDDTISQSLQNMATTKKIKKGVVKKDSVVNIDYMGVHNNMTFEGGSAEDVTLDISDDTGIADFNKQIIGHSVGETFMIVVNMPDNYAIVDLRGQDVLFQITINYLAEQVVPEYNLDYIKKNTDFDSLEDFEADVKKQILQEKEKQIKTNQRNEVLQKIVENAEMLEYPEDNAKLHYDNLYATYVAAASENAVSLEKYIKETYDISEKDFIKELKEQTKKEIKVELVLLAVAEKENIDIGVDAYKTFVDDVLANEGKSIDSFEEENGMSINEYLYKNNTYGVFLLETVLDKIFK